MQRSYISSLYKFSRFNLYFNSIIVIIITVVIIIIIIIIVIIIIIIIIETLKEALSDRVINFRNKHRSCSIKTGVFNKRCYKIHRITPVPEHFWTTEHHWTTASANFYNQQECDIAIMKISRKAFDWK